AVLDSGLAAISQIDSIVRDEAIACHFEWVPGYLHAPRGAGDPNRALFEEEAKAVSDLGFDASFAEDVPFVGGPGVLFENQARFHPRAYLAGLVRAIVARGGRTDALFWDTADPYHYLRIERHRDHDVVIFGGEDHKTGQAEDTNACYERLEGALKQLVPSIDITHRWSGQVIETPDGLPFIGET